MIVDTVTGSSKVFGLIGSPVSHTFSPIIHNTIAKELGHELIYVPLLVQSDTLHDAIKGAFALYIQGLNVTIPYKNEVIKYLSKTDESASIIGAVNTLKRTENGYVGYNTDVIGIKETFLQNDITIAGKSVLILGAGGTANSAATAALSENASEIYIVNRTLEKAHAIVENSKKHYSKEIQVLSYDQLSEIDRADIVIQTTSMGFAEQVDCSPITDKSFFEKVTVCLDIIYTPWETLFLKDAKQSSVKCINGFEMLIYQAISSYEIWNEIMIDHETKRKICDKLTVYIQNGFA